ncbi:hypothetical protein N8Z76_00465 [Gammaproteobacteria bacterium]|nr:hypothetical protein [Gammaproteobacteria bacterium]
MKITEKSKALFIEYAKDSGNWSGMPLVGGNVGYAPEDKGNLTHLKKLGLVTTHEDYEPGQEPCSWITFTQSGRIFAATLGIEIDEV